MIEVGALGHEVHDAAVGDVAAVLHLQAPQLRAPPRHDGQAPVRQPLAAAERERLHARQLVRGPGLAAARGAVPRQQPHDGPQREVGVDPAPAGQRDLPPQLGLPGEEVEPPAHPGAQDDLVGVEEGEDPDDDAVGHEVEVAGAADGRRGRSPRRRCRRRSPRDGRVLGVVREDVEVPDGSLGRAHVPQVVGTTAGGAHGLHRGVVGGGAASASTTAADHGVVAEVAGGGGLAQLPRQQLLLQSLVRRPREHHRREAAELVLVHLDLLE